MIFLNIVLYFLALFLPATAQAGDSAIHLRDTNAQAVDLAPHLRGLKGMSMGMGMGMMGTTMTPKSMTSKTTSPAMSMTMGKKTETPTTQPTPAPNAPPKWHQLGAYTFGKYLVDFNKSYEASELGMRRTLFNKQLARVRAHNGDAAQSYKQGINIFSDMTAEEFAMFKGAKRTAGPSPIPSSPEIRKVQASDYAVSIDWRKEGVTTPVKYQGGCGSCWAFSGTEVLETHIAILTGKLIVMAPQEFVSCMPNPEQCGGTGGCQGATPWLCFEYAVGNGMTTEADYP